MGQYAIKGKNLRLESLNTYTKCLMEIPTAKKLPPLENARFLRGLEKLDTKYWAYSYYELEEHLKVLLEMYDQSKLRNCQILAIMDCLKRELKKCISTG
jgi:hypothetical protein